MVCQIFKYSIFEIKKYLNKKGFVVKKKEKFDDRKRDLVIKNIENNKKIVLPDYWF